jgi:peptide/nickel transport system substrate-binding protein
MIPALLPYSPRWPPQWNLWYQSGGTKGEEPIADGKKLYSMIDELRIIADPKERSDKIMEIANFWHEMNFFLVPAEKALDPWLHNAKLKNVPTKGSRHAANTAAMVYYYED